MPQKVNKFKEEARNAKSNDSKRKTKPPMSHVQITWPSNHHLVSRLEEKQYLYRTSNINIGHYKRKNKALQLATLACIRPDLA